VLVSSWMPALTLETKHNSAAAATISTTRGADLAAVVTRPECISPDFPASPARPPASR